MPTIAEVLLAAAGDLREAGIETAALDARLLLERALNVSREALISNRLDNIDNDVADTYSGLIARRRGGEPVSSITGIKEFWSMKFFTTADTLDPRPDSETLVEAVLERFADRTAPLRILDLGTGTGCLLLSLLREYPGAHGTGTDISSAALEVAGKNAARLGLSARAQWLEGNWLGPAPGKFDVIVSNPPYIAAPDIALLPREVREFDPLTALDGGHDGLDAYRAIIPLLPPFLKSGGMAFFEVGAGQAGQVQKILEKEKTGLVSSRNDLAGIPRVVMVLVNGPRDVQRKPLHSR